MMPNHSANKSDLQMIDRQKFLQLVKAGLDNKAFQFIRQITMSWLASYPGDLEVNLLLVQALAQEGREGMAFPILDKILNVDPEFIEAVQTAEKLYLSQDATKSQRAAGLLQAMGYAPASGANLPAWGVQLFMAKQNLASNQLDSARDSVIQALTGKNSPSLAGIIHLEIAEKEGDLNARLNLGRVYHARWPECVHISLMLAKSLVENGSHDEAVNLAHECAALDPSAQIPQRIWGTNFDFKPLYPVSMQIVENFAIPAEVASVFGLNQLKPGEEPTKAGKVERPQPAVKTEVHSFDGYKVTPSENQPYPENPKIAAAQEKQKDPLIEEIKNEFEKIADHLKTPSAVRSDNRYPSYVILTTRTGLTQQYGQQSSQVILDELKKLAFSVQKKNNWHSFLFLPDDLTVCGKYGITPVDAVDPWKIKLALTDLDAALAKTGEMIGAVLIIGGDKIVPFHNLPNPTDDADSAVPSDNPYGSLDKNYFVGDWPVGRLPGDASSDSGLLLTQIRNLTNYHSEEASYQGWIYQIFRILLSWSQLYSKNFTNLGYTAAIWQRSSLSAFRPIGDGRNLFLSPNGKLASFNPDRIAKAPYCYFNLHGVEDGSNWYGQKDTSDTSSSEDYPVALQPAVLKKNANAPRIVFSEACYGGHILERKEDDSIALTFLGQGVLAVLASTTIAYGSVSTPLIGADLLGNLVMKNLVEGIPIGNAFIKAKVDFVREMNLRQGYLDGEDQKTLISFVLYGDPLVNYDPYQTSSKTISREKVHPTIKTVVDQDMNEVKSSPISAKAIANAKETARQYLPGIEYAEVKISRQHVRINGNTQPQGMTAGKTTSAHNASRMVVSFSKQVKFDQHIHRQYARVTLDQQGKVVKLAISR